MNMRLIWILFLALLAACTTGRLAVIKQNGKYGVVDKRGTIIVEPKWEWVMLSDGGNKPLLVCQDSLYGFIDREGKVLIQPQYKDAHPFYEGLAAVSDGKKFGFVNRKGKIVIPFAYDDVFLGFSKGLADVTRNDSCGYINKKGNVVIPLVYGTCYPFLSNYANILSFEFDSKVIDRKGRLVENPEKLKGKPLWLTHLNDGYVGIEGPKGRGLLNSKKDTVVEPIYKAVGIFKQGRAIVDYEGKWGAVNDKGNLVVKPQFDKLWHFSEGLAGFEINGKWGFINRSGQVIIKHIYDYVREFSSGLAYVELEGKAGFIDKKGQLVIKPVFEPYRLGGKFE